MTFESFKFRIKKRLFGANFSDSVNAEELFTNCGKKSLNYEKILDEKSLRKISKITERPIEEITALYNQFEIHSLYGELNQSQFHKLYTSLRHEDSKSLEKITDFIFRGFDRDKSGTIDFEEFAVKFLINI